MTTRAQIRSWTRSVLAADPRLELIESNLILTPVRHILRGIYVDRTSVSEVSTLRYYLMPLFDAPSPSRGFRWSDTVALPRNDSGEFQRCFDEACRHVVREALEGVTSIEDFVLQTTRDDLPPLLGLGGSRITRHYQEYAVALAALGRLDQARAVLAELGPDERRYRQLLESGQAMLAKRANSRIGAGEVRHAEFHLSIIANLTRLCHLLDAGNRVAIGQLLREWEHDAVKRWGVEHRWEPTPFPVELGVAD